MVHQVVLKTALFLAGGMIEHAGGSSRLSRLGDMARTAPLIAVMFFVPAMSLAGIPPMSGFTAKFALFDSVAASAEWWILGVAVTVAPADVVLDRQDLDRRVLGPGRSPARACGRRRFGARPPLMMVAPTVVLVTPTVALGVIAGPLYDYCLRAAGDLLDPSTYISIVLEGAGS